MVLVVGISVQLAYHMIGIVTIPTAVALSIKARADEILYAIMRRDLTPRRWKAAAVDTLIKWTPPPEDYLKLNVDGSRGLGSMAASPVSLGAVLGFESSMKNIKFILVVSLCSVCECVVCVSHGYNV
ncbi:uncharacterized protein DS421_5g159160 [Arachis hypogaea]|nr:uncharacterized protein DS421_5g159160 [Arachis hypogaea]